MGGKGKVSTAVIGDMQVKFPKEKWICCLCPICLTSSFLGVGEVCLMEYEFYACTLTLEVIFFFIQYWEL